MGDCEQRIQDCLSRIEAEDARIGAWEHVDAIGAMHRARELDGIEYAGRKGPLHGMAIGVKDIIDVAQLPTRCGSPIYATNIASADAACVALARAAGAIIIGKTVTTELATFVPARTKNPLNLEYTPGGSSAGSAAAVAAGMVPMAIGTQTAGSVIRPAAYCGVFGFKPTFGHVPREGVKLQSSILDTVGVFTRNISDTAKWYAAMTGASPSIETSTARLRIAVVTNLNEQANAVMLTAVEHAIEALQSAGVHIERLRLPQAFDDAVRDQKIIQLAEGSKFYAPEYQDFRAQLNEDIAAVLEEGARIDSRDFMAAVARASNLRIEADRSMGDFDCLLMPAAPGAAPHGFASTGDPLFSRVNSLLHQPAITLPIYKNTNGMPLGLQLIGARNQDRQLFTTAQRVFDAIKSNHHG